MSKLHAESRAFWLAALDCLRTAKPKGQGFYLSHLFLVSDYAFFVPTGDLAFLNKSVANPFNYRINSVICIGLWRMLLRPELCSLL